MTGQKCAAIQVVDNEGWSIQMDVVYGIISLTLNAVMYTSRTEQEATSFLLRHAYQMSPMAN